MEVRGRDVVVSKLERTFMHYWRLVGSDEEPHTEYMFHPYRKWRLDVAFPDHKVGVELQGATWARGRHTRGGGYEEDCWKLVEAQLLGWVVIWLTKGMLERDPALVCSWIKTALEKRGATGD
jgi:hypothetical protein